MHNGMGVHFPACRLLVNVEQIVLAVKFPQKRPDEFQ